MGETANSIIGVVIFIGLVYGMYRFVQYRKAQKGPRGSGGSGGGGGGSQKQKH